MAGIVAKTHQMSVAPTRLDLRQRKAEFSLRVRQDGRRNKAPLGKHPHRNRQAHRLPLIRRGYLGKQPAPSLEKSFVGIVNTGWIPPDTMGAAGTKHLVSVVNGGFAIFNKATGARMAFMTLQQFWSDLGTQKGQPAYFVYDPKILYDTFSGRFLIVSMAGTKRSSQPGSWFLLSISNPNDPFVWSQWAVQSDPNGPNWSDYPGIGLDRNYVYLSANMFRGDNFQYVKVWVIPKRQLFNRAENLKFFYFTNPPGAFFTTQPTQVYGSSPNGQYLIAVLNGRALKLNKITFVNGRPVWHQGRTIFVNHFPYPNVPKAQQKGTTQRIETNDTRLLNAVFRSGYIYTVHHVSSNDGKRTEVAGYQIATDTSTPVKQRRGRSASFSYYYPSIAVNAMRSIVVGFSGSSPTHYASAYFTGRTSSDPVGTMRAVALLKAGVAPYLENRWGEFSATVVDTDGASFVDC